MVKLIYRTIRWNLAKLWLRLWPDIDVIGIAGSVGKTTTKEMVASILGSAYKTIKTPENWDPIFNLPLTALRTPPSCKFVAELSIDAPGQMDKYLDLVKPRIGVITKLSLEHADTEHLVDLSTAIEEELKLVRGLPPYGWLIMNGDDPNIRQANIQTAASKLYYGFNKSNDVVITDFKQVVTDHGVVSRYTINFDHGSIKMESKLLGKENSLNTCAAVITGVVMGVDSQSIVQTVRKVEPVPGRLTPVKTSMSLIIDDTYNASPASVEMAIEVLTDVAETSKTILVLGDMLELGTHSTEQHKMVGRYAKNSGVDYLIAYGEMAEFVLQGFGNSQKSFTAKTHNEVADTIKRLGVKNSVILVKGSRGMGMENVVRKLLNQ